MDGSDTTHGIAALLTPRGRGAVATIAVRADAVAIERSGLFQAANGRQFTDQPRGRVLFGRWGSEPSEEVVLCRLPNEQFEIHCHGGEAASRRILSQLEATGVKTLDWREYLDRTEGRFATDMAAALAAAATPQTAAIIAAQEAGPLRGILQKLMAADPVRDQESLLEQLDSLLRWSRFGRHLTLPWRVVLYGAPNVGKSSLINALAGFERAIVFDRPGTTRDVVTAETAINGWPVRLSDTAGLRSSTDELETQGIERTQSELAEANLRILVIDRSLPPDGNQSRQSLEPPPDLVVANKCDRPDTWGEQLPAECLPVSAKTGSGVLDLLERIAAVLVPAVPSPEEPVPVTDRQVVAITTCRKAVLAGNQETYYAALRGIFP